MEHKAAVITNLTVRDVYRASDTKRWQIVKTARSQSVAEHSYQVAMIAARICQVLGLDEATQAKVIWYALTHDLPEVLTGDLASPLKRLLGEETRGILRDLETSITYLGLPVLRVCEVVGEVVKAADLIEAIKFLDENKMTDHGAEVQADLTKQLAEMGGPVIMQVLREILSGPYTTLDDLVRVRAAEAEAESNLESATLAASEEPDVEHPRAALMA